MMDDPYSGLVRMFREEAAGQTPVFFRLGKVQSVNPLRISLGQTEQSGNDLLKNADIGELHSGDNVLLASMDNDQKFVVICRVVSA